MKCDEIMELLSAYLDGETTDTETYQVKRHLAECAECRNILDEYSALNDGIRGIQAIEERDNFKQILRNRLSAGMRRRRIVSITKYAVAALLLVSIATVALMSIRPEDNNVEQESLAELPNLYLLEDPEFLGIGQFDEGIGSAMELDIALNGI